MGASLLSVPGKDVAQDIVLKSIMSRIVEDFSIFCRRAEKHEMIAAFTKKMKPGIHDAPRPENQTTSAITTSLIHGDPSVGGSIRILNPRYRFVGLPASSQE